MEVPLWNCACAVSSNLDYASIMVIYVERNTLKTNLSETKRQIESLNCEIIQFMRLFCNGLILHGTL